MANCNGKVVAIVSLVALVCNLVAAAPTHELLRKVCANERIILNSDQVKQVAEENEQLPVDSDDTICPQRWRPSIGPLNELVSTGQDDICSMEKAKAIADYFEKYILDEPNKAAVSIGMYYISYGMKVSKACRRRMVNSIADTAAILTVGEQEFMDIWTNETSLIGHIFNEPSDYDDLVLPKSLAKYLSAKPERIFMQTTTGDKLKRLQVICERRWKPIYGPLILPLITLSEVGFNYRDEKEQRQEEVNKLVYKWYRTVFLCETLSSMVIVDDPNFNVGDSETERRMIKVLTKEEVDQLPGGREALLEQLANGYPEIERLEYQPPKEHEAQLTMPVVEPGNMELVNAIRRFKTTRKGSANFLQKMFNQVRNKLNSGLLKFALNKANIPDANELIKFLDEYENKLSTAGEAAVASSQARKDLIAKIIVYTLVFAFFAGIIGLGVFLASISGGSGSGAAAAAAGFAWFHFFG